MNENTNRPNATPGDISSAGDAGRQRVRGDLGDVGRNRPFDFGVDSSDVELNETELKALFESFIQTFRPEKNSNAADDWDDDIFETSIPRPPHYLYQLQTLFENNQSSNTSVCNFPIDLFHLKSACPKLLRSTIRYPADVIIFMDEVLADMVERNYASYGISRESLGENSIAFKTSLFHHPHIRCMRDLDPKDIETLIAIRGIIIRCSSIMPDMRESVFRCTSRSTDDLTGGVCGHEERVRLAAGCINEPLQCLKCQSKYSFELFHAECVFGNKQLVRIQETPETIPEGETPHTVVAYLYDDLVDTCKPGDFVELTGIFRASGVRILPRVRTLKSVYRNYIDANSIHKDHLNRYLVAEADMEGPAADADMEEYESQNNNRRHSNYDGNISPEMIERMKGIGHDPNVYQKLVKSLAPNIWESDDVKKGLLCQLFGGTAKVIGGRVSRSDIHILLCGDPSTAKSQLLKYAHGIAPRGVYTCGRGSSAVGLTASVTRDPESKEFILESGAIILSDRGICCIDEFDKMDESARIILHEVMEQQTVSIAKAGIVCSLNARTAILASANPINSRYDIRRSVVDNISLPSTLMSRFDLIYLMLDCVSETVDRSLAEHLCRLYSTDRQLESEGPPIDRKTFAQYISYAKEYCKPTLTEASSKMLVEAYLQLRQRGNDGKYANLYDVNIARCLFVCRSLGATPRQLESLIRLSEALAKMELSETVDVKHVKEAIRLMQVATYSALVDPTTGRLDFDQLNAGESGGSRARKEMLESLLLVCLNATASGLDKTQLAEKMSEKLKKSNEYPIDPAGKEFNSLLKELEEFGKIGRVHGGKIISQVTS